MEVLRLDRPEVRNALDTASLTAILDALEELQADDDLRVLVFSTPDTKALCAGADERPWLPRAFSFCRSDDGRIGFVLEDDPGLHALGSPARHVVHHQTFTLQRFYADDVNFDRIALWHVRAA